MADTDAQRVMDAIRRLVQTLRVGSRSAERGVGLSSAQLFVLERLAASKKPLSVNELAERTLTHQSSVSVVVQKLEKRGLVRRSPAAEDARRAELSLAPAAVKLLKDAPRTAQDQIIDALSAMPASHRATLAKLLGELSDGLGDGAGGAAAPAMFFEDDHAKRGTRRARS
jgi:DNA-binding MarR family transcriptional regulator